jgi:hypothetical protein
MREDPWAIRTNFDNDLLWCDVCSRIAAPQSDDKFRAYVSFVDDRRFEAKDIYGVVHLLPDDYAYSFCFIVDAETFDSDERLVLVASFLPEWDEQKDDFIWQPPRLRQSDLIKWFRAIPDSIQSIENNLSIANMDFEDFADAVDSDGVFRGFGRTKR